MTWPRRSATSSETSSPEAILWPPPALWTRFAGDDDGAAGALDLLRGDARTAAQPPAQPGVAVTAVCSRRRRHRAPPRSSASSTVLINALPHADPEQLVVVFEKVPGACRRQVRLPPRPTSRSCASRASHAGMAVPQCDLRAVGNHGARRLDAARVSPEIFTAGASPSSAAPLRRTRTGNAKVVVLSHGL